MSKVIISDSGPIIHLDELNTNFVWNIFDKIMVPEVVFQEVTKYNLPGSKIIKNDKFQIIK